MDIVVSRHPKHRGQAYLAYRDLISSANALRAGHSFPLGGKPIKIAYAKRDTDIINEYLGVSNAMLRKKQQAKREKGIIEGGKTNIVLKKAKKKGEEEEEPAVPKTSDTLIGDPDAPKNHVLFVENLPSNRTNTQIQVLFNQFDGFKEVRLNDSKLDVAFIEFKDNFTAERAKKALDRFNITPQNSIKVTFARM